MLTNPVSVSITETAFNKAFQGPWLGTLHRGNVWKWIDEFLMIVSWIFLIKHTPITKLRVLHTSFFSCSCACFCRVLVVLLFSVSTRGFCLHPLLETLRYAASELQSSFSFWQFLPSWSGLSLFQRVSKPNSFWGCLTKIDRKWTFFTVKYQLKFHYFNDKNQ